MSPEKNPFNYNILKGGQVDPTSKLYQRSVSSREKLGEFLSKQWNNGGDEADVFMAGVKSLMSRGHGYVGAYLDSKNPGRTYTKNEAMAITDAVMSKEGIGDHPGARMTRDKSDEGKAARKEANKARGFGPKQAAGAKAMPVGQQRKQPGGRGKGTGVPADPGDRSTNERENLSKPPSGPTSPEWQNVLEKRMKGEATTQDVLESFKNKYQSRLSDSPEKKAEKEEKAKARRDNLRDSIATGGRSTEDGDTTGPEDTGAPEPEETAPQAIKVEGRVQTELLGNFDRAYKDARKLLIDNEKRKTKNRPWDPKKEKDIQPGEDDVRFLIEDSIDSLNEQYGGKLDTKSAKDKLRKLALYKLGFDPYEGEDEGPGDQAAPESQAPAQPESEPPAQPEAKPPAQPEAKPPAQPSTEAPAQPEAKPPAQPEAKSPAQPGTQAPAQPAPRKDTGFKPPRQPAPRGGEGFTPSSKEERAKKVKEVVSALPELGKQSFEDFKASLYNFQPSLLGKQGSDTDPDAEPFPAGPEESAPSSDLPGAPSSRPAPPTAKAGQPGQQSMFRADGITPRTGRGFGSNVPKPAAQPEPSPQPSPQPAPEPENKGFGKDVQKGKKATPNTPAEKPAGPETYKQGNIFGGRGYETGQAGNPLEDQPADPYAKYRGEPIEPKTVTEPAEANANKPGQQSMFKSGTTTPRTGKYFGSKPEPSVPERAEGASPKDRLKQLMDSGLTSAQAGRQVIAESGKGPRKNAAQRKAAKKKGVSNSAEYQEFAQSIRAMMR